MDPSPEDLDSYDSEGPRPGLAGLSSLIVGALARYPDYEGGESTPDGDAFADPLADLCERVIEGTVDMEQYQLFNVLGRGGMGTVFLARDTELDRQVAIKLWNSDEPEHQLALLREAGMLAKLSHPNIVTIYASGRHEDRVFFVMEYVGGSDSLLWRKMFQPDWREVLRVGIAAGQGLAAAHGVGVVHHDFKPLNLLVGDDGRVKIIDFG
ncbi:MAG: serine/threonine protein kinase, partial [Myxococcales bacterium]|nr:serine/threonine protein kinase [Myxococcales bacterium]